MFAGKEAQIEPQVNRIPLFVLFTITCNVCVRVYVRATAAFARSTSTLSRLEIFFSKLEWKNFPLKKAKKFFFRLRKLFVLLSQQFFHTHLQHYTSFFVLFLSVLVYSYEMSVKRKHADIASVIDFFEERETTPKKVLGDAYKPSESHACRVWSSIFSRLGDDFVRARAHEVGVAIEGEKPTPEEFKAICEESDRQNRACEDAERRFGCDYDTIEKAMCVQREREAEENKRACAEVDALHALLVASDKAKRKGDYEKALDYMESAVVLCKLREKAELVNEEGEEEEEDDDDGEYESEIIDDDDTLFAVFGERH